MLDDLAQSCPCCRSEGCPLDRAVFDDEDVEENQTEDTDSDYEEDDDASSQSEHLNEVSDGVLRGSLRLERNAAGRWVLVDTEDVAFESLRNVFGPINDLDSEEIRVSVHHRTSDVDSIASLHKAAAKIQAFYRGNQVRNTHEAAIALYRLFQQAYTL